MEITRKQYDEWYDSLIGKLCPTHGTVIKAGKYGNWCGEKDLYGKMVRRYHQISYSYPVCLS